MKRFKKNALSSCIVLFLLFISLGSTNAMNRIIKLNDPGAKKIVLAKIGDRPVTVGDIVKFAKSSPAFYGFLEVPGGPDRLLKELVLERLIVLEGRSMKIPEPANHDEALYLMQVKRQLLPPLPPVTAQEAHRYYNEHLSEFSTPLLLRLSQVKVYFNDKNREKALAKIEKALREIKGGADFGLVAKKYSEEPISASRLGDIGFIPVSSLPETTAGEIKKLRKGQVSRILTIGHSFTIVKLTDKREPMVDPYKKVRALAAQKAQRARDEKRVERLRRRLEKKWKVVYLNE